jgi:hypothetical protein
MRYATMSEALAKPGNIHSIRLQSLRENLEVPLVDSAKTDESVIVRVPES